MPEAFCHPAHLLCTNSRPSAVGASEGRLVDIEFELADLIVAERVVGRILAEPGAGPAAFTLLTNWSFSPFREASEAARTAASRSRRSQ
jgi:hypothetical protein